jgi:DegV family protein with EDD domain
MQNIAIVTDSGCDLPQSYVKQCENLYVMPLMVRLDDGEYRSGVDIDTEQLLVRMEQGETAKTSLPDPGGLDELFEALKQKGITHIAFILMSAALSGTVNMVRLACQHHGEFETFVYDSKVLSMALGYIVMGAVEQLNSGATFQELEQALPKIREEVDCMFYLPALDYLIAGGRIGRVAGMVGKLLNIKPIIGCDENGVYYARATAVGARRTVQTVKRIVQDFVAGRNFELSIVHAGALADAKKLLEEFREIPGMLAEQILPLGPALAAHVGRGMLAVCARRQPIPQAGG